MATPIDVSLAPMLARSARALPSGNHLYEPKWDGFRCLVFRDGDEIDLRSRNHKPLARYFPEVVEAVRTLPERHLVLDGEILATRAGRFDFASLLARLHPAPARVARLRDETPARLVAFDLLACGGEDVRDRPFRERRAALTGAVSGGGTLSPTPLTDDRELAARWLRMGNGAGIDGVVAKHAELRYLSGRRAMTKVKTERSADCVVAGVRWFAHEPLPSSLLLGLYDDGGLRHVGIASSFSRARSVRLLDDVRPLLTPLEGHPWEHGFLLAGGALGRLRGAAGRWAPGEMDQDWTPLAPVRVCEVAYEHVDEGRLRHPARFRRWRPDRDPRSCTLDQLATPPLDPARVLDP